MLREMLACSSHEKLPPTRIQTYLYMHTYLHTYIRACIHTYVFTHKLLHTPTYMHTDLEVGELCGGGPRWGLSPRMNGSMYNTRWTGPAVVVNISPPQPTLFLE